jgi:hypothetical protein
MRAAARSRTRARGPAASEKMASMSRTARVSLSSLEAIKSWPRRYPICTGAHRAQGAQGGRTEEEGGSWAGEEGVGPYSVRDNRLTSTKRYAKKKIEKMLQIEKGNKCEDWNPSNSDFIWY